MVESEENKDAAVLYSESLLEILPMYVVMPFNTNGDVLT